jgi:hypothetical protein
VKKPEHAVKLFIRFAVAKGVITYGLELMLAFVSVIQGGQNCARDDGPVMKERNKRYGFI